MSNMHALFEALGFEDAACRVEFRETDAQIILDARDGLFQRGLGCDVMRVGIDFHRFQFSTLLAGERIEFGDLLHLIAEQRDAPGAIIQVRREEFDGIAAHAECAAHEILVIAFVMQRHEIGDQLALRKALAFLDLEGHGRIGFDIADAVDARHGGHDNDIVALEQ